MLLFLRRGFNRMPGGEKPRDLLAFVEMMLDAVYLLIRLVAFAHQYDYIICSGMFKRINDRFPPIGDDGIRFS